MSLIADRISREIETAPEPVLAEVLDFVLFVKARNASAEAAPAIRRTPGVCGGEACIRMTRVAVWILEEARRAGVTDEELLADYPELDSNDLTGAWNYVGDHRDEIESAIAANRKLTSPRVMAAIYANENFPRRVVEALRQLGDDVLTSQEAGRANQMVPEEDVLNFAVEQDRAVLTLNRLDFFRLHRDTAGCHSGIIACTRDDADPKLFAGRIDAAIRSVESLDGQLLRVVRPFS